VRSFASRHVRRAVLVPLTAALLIAQPMAALAAPDNDDRANATPVTSIPFFDVVDVTDATVEDDEPGASCLTYYDDEYDETWEVPVGHTVWYEVSLSRRAQVLVDTAGSGFDTVAVVYDSNLNEIACNDDAGTLQAKVDFAAQRGETYLVRIGSYGDDIDEEYDDPTLVVSIDRGRVKTRNGNQGGQERYSFRGLQASASNWWYDEGDDWFAYSGEGVGLTDGRQQDSWSRGNNRISEVYVYSYEGEVDFEKQTETFSDWWGYDTLRNGGIDRRLRSAYVDQDVWVEGLSCTGPIYDWDEDEYVVEDDEEIEFFCTELGSGTVRAAVDWTGYGPTTRITERSRYVDEWGTYTFRYRASERAADVVGGVSGEVLSFDLTGADGWLSDVQVRDTWRYARR
jgi:hypothetical protein